MKNLFCLVLSGALLSGCAMTFDLVGGPKNERTSLGARNLLDEMEPKVRESKGAFEEIASVRTRSRVGNVFLYSGMGMLVPCIGAPMLSRGGFSGATMAVTIGTCSAVIVLEVLAIAVLPKMGSYANVLRAFNLDFPSTPYSSDGLGVATSQ